MTAPSAPVCEERASTRRHHLHPLVTSLSVYNYESRSQARESEGEKKTSSIGNLSTLTAFARCKPSFSFAPKPSLNIRLLEPVNRLFFATDNLETREKIKKYLLGKNISDIYYNDNKIVSPKENSVEWMAQQEQNFKNINSYIEVINDAFNLSNSRTLIYRTSSVSNLAILLSKSIKERNVILL